VKYADVLVLLAEEATVLQAEEATVLQGMFDRLFEIGSIYYTRNQLDATLAVLFINNCKNTLHVSDVHRVHHQEYINCS
jgi:uncharacterized membrane protein YhfC